MDTYLDHNATTPVRPEAADAVARALTLHGNASSVHRFGRLVRHTLDEARESVASLVDVSPANIIFTSGGTEANNQALRGFDGSVLVSAIEHDSVLGAREDAQIVDVAADGVLVIEHLREKLARCEGPTLVSVMLANNEPVFYSRFVMSCVWHMSMACWFIATLCRRPARSMFHSNNSASI